MDERCDVLIAGAGPAGCAAAALLADRGRRVLLLERGAVPHARLCTHAIMPAGLPVLAQMGVLDRIEAAGAQRWWGVRLLLNGVPLRAALPHAWAAFPYGLSLRRERLDPILLHAVRQRATAEVRTGWSVEGLLGHAGVVSGARVRDAEGGCRRIGARLVVAADGRHSRLARAARLPERLLPNRHTALIAYIDGVPPDERPCLEGFYDRGRSASMLPADGGLRVAGVMATPDRWPRAEWPGRILAELRRYPGMADRLAHARVVSAPTPVRGLRNALRWPARPGFAAIGDAAAQTDPAFGQGIAWGLRAGRRLAQAADRVLRAGDGPVLVRAGAVWEPVFLPLFAGISLFSAIPPGSTLERLVVASAAESPQTSALALRAILGLAATPAPGTAPALVASRWLRETVRDEHAGALPSSTPTNPTVRGGPDCERGLGTGASVTAVPLFR